MSFSNFNLAMLNLWIGLCRGVKGLPRSLRDLGYQVEWIEYHFSNSDLKRVKPDLILASDSAEHTLLLELKEGANTKADQLHRYSRITSEDLRERAFLGQASATHDVTINGKGEHQERLIKGVEKSGHGFPVLVVIDTGIARCYSRFSYQKLNDVFDPVLEIDFSKCPLEFLPFDLDSEKWEVAERIVPEIITQMYEHEPRILANKIAQKAVKVWDIIGEETKKEYITKITDIVDQASRDHFKKYLKRNSHAAGRTQTPTWEIIRNPLNLGADKQRNEFKKLKRIQKAFIESLKIDTVQTFQRELFEDADD